MPEKATSQVLRAVDANVNRFRDALRVIEDTLRFVRVSPGWAGIRRLRNDFSALFAGDHRRLLVSRDSARDPGRASSQRGHPDIESVLRANFARCSESLRVLEEYSRLRSVRLPSTGKLKNVRFRLYAAEKKVALAGSRPRPVSK